MSAATVPVPASHLEAVRFEALGGNPHLFRRFRTWWTLLALFLMAAGNGIFSVQEKHYYLKVLKRLEEPSTSLFLATVAMFLICAGLMFGHLGLTRRMMLKQKAVLVFAVLAYLSAFWSQVPLLTIRKATILLLMMAFAWFFAQYYTPTDQMRILLALGVIMALASIAWALFLPGYGVSPNGEWKGVFVQKNALGSTMLFLFSALPFCRISSAHRLLIVALQAIVPIGLILLSQSRTSLFMAVIIVVARVFGPMTARMRRDAIPFILSCAGLGIALAVVCLRIILQLLGRDFTLTGRTYEWSIIFPFALKHLWFGYGYQSFWLGTIGDSGSVIAMLHAGQNVADSGYLDIMLQFGVLGLGLLFILLTVCIRDFAKLFRSPLVPLTAYWYASLILAIFVGSITEGMLWMPIRIIPFMLALSCAGLRNSSEPNPHLSCN